MTRAAIARSARTPTAGGAIGIDAFATPSRVAARDAVRAELEDESTSRRSWLAAEALHVRLARTFRAGTVCCPVRGATILEQALAEHLRDHQRVPGAGGAAWDLDASLARPSWVLVAEPVRGAVAPVCGLGHAQAEIAIACAAAESASRLTAQVAGIRGVTSSVPRARDAFLTALELSPEPCARCVDGAGLELADASRALADGVQRS